MAASERFGVGRPARLSRAIGRATLFAMSDIDFLVGESVLEIREDYRIVFKASAEPEPRLYVDVAGPCDCVDAEGERLALSDLIGRTVASTSTTSGVLMLVFADGASLRCQPSDDVEAWQVVGGTPAHLVVCTPGGGVSVFGSPNVFPLSEFRERAPGLAAKLDELLETFGMPPPDGYTPAGGDKAQSPD